MNEKPILFSGEMVRAILDGRKTQTRRVIKPQPHGLCADIPSVIDAHFLNAKLGWRFEDREGRRSHDELRCPYGLPGDRLWVRETHVFEWWEDEPKPPTDRPLYHHKGDGTEFDEPYWLWPHYRATDPAPELCYEDDPHGGDGPMCKWRPSIFMPRWASRITLEIVNVRVERLKEITQADVLAEGIKHTEGDGYWLAPLAGVPDYPWNNAISAYVALWNSINEKRGYDWNINPWVWVVEFKRLEQGTEHAQKIDR